MPSRTWRSSCGRSTASWPSTCRTAWRMANVTNGMKRAHVQRACGLREYEERALSRVAEHAPRSALPLRDGYSARGRPAVVAVSGGADAERPDARRSRKARAPILRGDSRPCDPRRSGQHRRISAPGVCRTSASIVAAPASSGRAGCESTRRACFPGSRSGRCRSAAPLRDGCAPRETAAARRGPASARRESTLLVL